MRRIVPIFLLLAFAPLAPSRAVAQVPPAAATPQLAPSAPSLPVQIPDLTKSENLSSTLELIALVSVLSLAPAILLMVTSFTRIIIVLSLLRQALGAQQLPPNQVLVGLSLFMTFLVMGPTWNRVNNEALQPYLNKQIDQKVALEKGLDPIRQFMATQIDRAGNDADVDVLTDAAHLPRAKSWDEVPTTALI